MILDQNHLETRENLIRYFTRYLENELTKVNSAFRFIRIESPVLLADDRAAVRPTTVYGAHVAAKNLLDQKIGPKYKLPLVMWEYGKIFQTFKKQVLETNVLTYNVLFSKTTGKDYVPVVVRSIKAMLRKQCGKIFSADESDCGLSIFSHDSDEVLVHIQERNDFTGGRDIEVVCFLDRCTEANIQFEFGKIRRAPPIDKK
jgi:hypothetical protein